MEENGKNINNIDAEAEPLTESAEASTEGISADPENTGNGLAGLGAEAEEFTAGEEDIRFNPATDTADKTEQELKGVKKRRHFRWYIVIPLVLFIILAVLFIGWHIKPGKKLNVCLINKTVLTLDEDNGINRKSLYRKHQGFFWILGQQKYLRLDKKLYDYKNDYFGPMLNDEGKIERVKNLSELDGIPDLMYISDLYGAVNDTYGYFKKEDAEYSGISSEDMLAVIYSHNSGATVIAESEIFNSAISGTASNQISSLCGVSDTGWVGRYIVDLADMSDVPDWAPPMYEQQEGVEWQFEGPGILLASREGKIIILEQKTDFNSKNLLEIYVNKSFKKEFKLPKCNFYNWFTLIEANNGSEVIATFEFDVNATGMEKMRDVSKTPRFAAITRKNYDGKAPAYFFAGDFDDYVSRENYNKFLFADHLYRWISYDRQGDITNFYWNFYSPLMKKILKDVYKTADHTDDVIEEHTEVARLKDGQIELNGKDGYKVLPLKAVSINATAPGSDKYSTDASFYNELMSHINSLGANCVLAKDLLPEAFYQAVYENNKNAKNNKIYIIQNITPPDSVKREDYLKDDALKAYSDKITDTIAAIHGSAAVKESQKLQSGRYFIDVSQYVIAVTADANIDEALVTAQKNSGYTYSGKYASGSNPSSSFAAYLYDKLQTEYVKQHGFKLPVGVSVSPDTVNGINPNKENTLSVTAAVSEEYKDYSFTAVALNESSPVFTAHTDWFTKQDTRYYDCLKKLNEAEKNVLVTDISASVNAGSYSLAAGVNERAQGNLIVSMLTDVKKSGAMGGVIYDLNDDWSAISSVNVPFTVPSENKSLWHDVTDSKQTTGILSVSTALPTETEMLLADDDRMQHMYMYTSPEYLYLTVELLNDIDHDKETFFIGIDTYQRNDGEYFYSAGYTATSLSGMEYVIKWSGKQDAELMVAESYDRSNGKYCTKESYTGAYRRVAKLNYGGFSASDSQFYQTGSIFYVRIPWSWLNVTDPSQSMVLNNPGALEGNAKVTATDGMLFSVLIADADSHDLLYAFPEKKSDPGYKLFKWKKWSTVSYMIKEKSAFKTIMNYFAE